MLWYSFFWYKRGFKTRSWISGEEIAPAGLPSLPELGRVGTGTNLEGVRVYERNWQWPTKLNTVYKKWRISRVSLNKNLLRWGSTKLLWSASSMLPLRDISRQYIKLSTTWKVCERIHFLAVSIEDVETIGKLQQFFVYKMLYYCIIVPKISWRINGVIMFCFDLA